MLKNNKKNSWEWRCFYGQEKVKNNILNLIDFNIPKPKNIEYTDKYIIIPNLSHNIKLRKTTDPILEELHVKKIIKTQNNIFKFSRKTKFSFPIIENDLLISLSGSWFSTYKLRKNNAPSLEGEVSLRNKGQIGQILCAYRV